MGFGDDEDQFADSVGDGEREGLGDVAAHRRAQHGGALDPECVEQADHVLDVVAERECGRAGAPPVATHVGGDDVVGVGRCSIS